MSGTGGPGNDGPVWSPGGGPPDGTPPGRNPSGGLCLVLLLVMLGEPAAAAALTLIG